MLRILIFIMILFLALPYINKAKNMIADKMPEKISVKKIRNSFDDALDKIKK